MKWRWFKSHSRLFQVRVVVQFAFFALFFWLFLKTTYSGEDILSLPVNIFLRIDPLVAVGTSLAAKTFITIMWPSLIIIGLTIVFGRLFCGWLCPLGAILDGTDWLVWKRLKRKRLGRSPSLSRFKYALLLLILVSAVFSLQLLWILDPISLTVRSFAVAVYPYFNFGADSFFNWLYWTEVPAITSVSEPIFQFLKGTVLSATEQHFYQALPIFMFFLAIIGLSYFQERFWCRNLCPLGALLGVCSKFRPFKRHVIGECTSCAQCRTKCKTGAILDDERIYSDTECINCFGCLDNCRQGTTFSFRRGEVASVSMVDLSRRAALGSLAGGVLLVPVIGYSAVNGRKNPALIRPPGAHQENEFLDRCTRCGECMKVCPTNALHPSLFEGGFKAMWTPMLIPTLGYCEYNCTLCGQVCPTQAIVNLPKEKKQTFKMGTAAFKKDYCIPYRLEQNCIVCEEHCPVPEKAIKFKEIPFVNEFGEDDTLKQPYVKEELCIGCGICENKCPLRETPGVVVSNYLEQRGT